MVDPKRSFLRDPGQAQTLNKEIMRFLLPYRIKLAPSTTTHRQTGATLGLVKAKGPPCLTPLPAIGQMRRYRLD